jgi:dGTPase
VREGIIKHATDYDTPEAEGYEPLHRSSLEGQVINLADEVAYNTHDLDDGLRSGLIRAAQLRDVALWRDALATLGIAPDAEIGHMDRNRIVRYLVNAEVTAAIDATAGRLADIAPASVDEVRAQPGDLVAFSPEMSTRNRELKDFLLNNLYRHYRVIRMQEKAQRVVARLFETYVAEPLQLPFEVQARVDGDSRQRVVCDYVAGMTDRYALQEYRKLFDPEEPV